MDKQNSSSAPHRVRLVNLSTQAQPARAGPAESWLTARSADCRGPRLTRTASTFSPASLKSIIAVARSGDQAEPAALGQAGCGICGRRQYDFGRPSTDVET